GWEKNSPPLYERALRVGARNILRNCVGDVKTREENLFCCKSRAARFFSCGNLGRSDSRRRERRMVAPGAGHGVTFNIAAPCRGRRTVNVLLIMPRSLSSQTSRA